MNLAEYGWLPRVVFSVSALAARTADAIIVNSAAGRDYHVSRGYPAAAVVVIPNGIDTDMFKPDLDGRARVRSALRIPESDVVVGLVGRLDPVKDHELFLRASALLHREHANLRVICAGGGPRSYQSELESLASTLGLHERAIWLDAVPDVPGLYNALDLLCSSSRSEGFSNVIGEAMATGIACAVTATGDSEAIVGKIGVVTRSHDPESLAAAMAEALRRRSKSLAAEARNRVMENYSVAAMTSRTHAVLFDFTKTGLPGRRFHASI
jgi:glycosyltransferase involved in cell wall biosynthesis